MEVPDKTYIPKNIISASDSSDDNLIGTSPSSSDSPSLRDSLSAINLSDTGSPLKSQLEQLANTNLLTVRFSFEEGMQDSKHRSLVVGGLESLIHHYKGYLVSEEHIEPYEYIQDNKRLEILQKKKDIHIYESCNVEFAKSYTEEVASSEWQYDSVLQVQFKRSNVLLTVADEAQKFLQSHKSIIDKWSISACEHALTQPGNLYVRGIPVELSLDKILPIFSKFGPVSSLKIICDDVTGESLGYGFLSYPLGSQASLCIRELNGKTFENSTLFVNYHIERKERERIYRDNIKENSHDEKFKSIFIGNIPLNSESKDIITPDNIIQLLLSKVRQEIPDLKILSYYFPKRNESDGTDMVLKEKENNETSQSVLDNTESSSNHLIEPLIAEGGKFKNYGFIKMGSHEQAVKAIELLNNYKWHGTNLIVNKAEKNKCQNSHQRPQNDKTVSPGGSGFRGKYRLFSYGSSPNGNPFGYYNGSGSVFFPYVNSQVRGQSNHNQAKRQDLDHLYGMNQPMSSNAFINPFHMYRGVSSANNNQNAFDGTNPTNAMYPMNPYTMMPHNTRLALPLPAKDQQESNLYVKHLPLTWKDEDLYKFYEDYGEIISAKIITVGGSKNKDVETSDNKDFKKYSRDTPSPADEDGTTKLSLGASRGYGFVCFKNPLDASRAIFDTDGYQLTPSHILNVSFAQKRSKSVANQGAESNKSFSAAPVDGMMSGQPKFGRTGRSVSYPDHSAHSLNLKYMNSARHQGGGNTGRNYSNYMHDIGNWANVPIMPNVGPGMPGMRFMPPNRTSMMGSYMIQPGQMMDQGSE